MKRTILFSILIMLLIVCGCSKVGPSDSEAPVVQTSDVSSSFTTSSDTTADITTVLVTTAENTDIALRVTGKPYIVNIDNMANTVAILKEISFPYETGEWYKDITPIYLEEKQYCDETLSKRPTDSDIMSIECYLRRRTVKSCHYF